MARSAALQHFLDEAGAVLRAGAQGAAARVAGEVIARWQTAGQAGTAGPETLPVCTLIAPALRRAEASGPARLSAAFAALADDLAWRRRASADPADAAFWNGHANAEILGPRGLEQRHDLWLGATVMAPGLDYPRHNHPPEEIYLALSPGQWWNAAAGWAEPGTGGFIHNPPGIEHTMRSGSEPLLALWFLPL